MRAMRKLVVCLVLAAPVGSGMWASQRATASTDGTLGVPTGCWKQTGTNAVWGRCSGGYGDYRVKAVCSGNLTSTSAWQPAGGLEVEAYCPVGHQPLVSGRIETRSGA